MISLTTLPANLDLNADALPDPWTLCVLRQAKVRVEEYTLEDRLGAAEVVDGDKAADRLAYPLVYSFCTGFVLLQFADRADWKVTPLPKTVK